MHSIYSKGRTMMSFDPSEIVKWEGVGNLTLKTAVQRVLALQPDQRKLVILYRDAGKEPASLDINDIEKLADLPEYGR